MPKGISYKVKGYSGPDDMREESPGGLPYIEPLPFHSSPWRWMHEPQPVALMIYPIIEVDTTVPPASACVPVENVQVAVDGTTATVTWDDFPNYTEVRLRYGFAGQPQSTWTEVDVAGSTLYTLTGLLPSMPYGVTVTSSFNLSRIEIYDLRGVLTYSEPVAGHDVTLPLDFLRAGTYIVGIHTHNGTTHKRLMVIRLTDYFGGLKKRLYLCTL